MSQVPETVHFYCWNNKTFQDNRQGILSRTRLKTSFITRLIKRWRTYPLVGRNAILRSFVKNLSGYNEDEIMDYIIIFTCNCGITNKQIYIYINSQKYSSSPTGNEVLTSVCHSFHGERGILGGTPPPEEWRLSVRILLECFLVKKHYYISVENYVKLRNDQKF